MSQVGHHANARLSPGFLSMKHLGVFLLLPPPRPGGILAHGRFAIKFAGMHQKT